MRSLLLVAFAGVAAADPYTPWDKLQPPSKSAHLELSRLELKGAPRIVALDGEGRPVIEDGTAVSRVVANKLVALSASTSTPKSPTYWWRAGTLMAVDASDHVFTIATPKLAGDRHWVQLGSALYYVVDDKLVSYDLTTKQTKSLVATGREYEGAIATDGKQVFVADRDSLWSYDPKTDRKTTLPQEFYWPGALAFHDGRFLIDIHGHGAAVFRPTEKSSTSLGSSLSSPSDIVGWSGDNALVIQTQGVVTTTDGEVTDVGAPYTEAITCWRARGLHTLYRTAPGVQLCDVRVQGSSLSWLEYTGDDYCQNADALVTARLVGNCE